MIFQPQLNSCVGLHLIRICIGFGQFCKRLEYRAMSYRDEYRVIKLYENSWFESGDST